MATRRGDTLIFPKPPVIAAHACIGGKKEGESPLAAEFDELHSDNRLGQASWEAAETQLQLQTARLCLKKAHATEKDVSLLLAGDLQAQCTASGYAARALGLPETAVSPVLLGMGLCSAASNLFSGCLAEKGGLKPLPVFFAAQVLLFAVLPLLLVNRWLGLTGLFAMGLLMYLLNTPVQVHSLGLAEAEYPAAASLCASVQPVSYNFGIAAGSFAGSLVQDAWGLRLLGVPAAVFALLSLWQCRGLLRSIQRGKTRR